jgi:hypothetical protein
VKKVHISVTFLLITFFGGIFSKLQILRFFDTHIELKKSFLLLLVPFVNFDFKCAGNGSKKRNIFFMNVECVLENLIMRQSKGLHNQVVKTIVP